jgi:hypothetical protein
MESPSPPHGVQRPRCSLATAAACLLPATAVCGLLALAVAVACCVGGADAQLIDAGDCKCHTLLDLEQ